MASPVQLNPTGVRGNDGDWTVYTVTVGNPAQSFSVLPSTVLSDIWAISTNVCQYQTGNALINCETNRGSLFSPSSSNTWKYVFNNSTQAFSLGIEGSYGWSQSDIGFFGTDAVTLASTKSSIPVSGVIIGSMNTNATATGLLGLASKPVSLVVGSENSTTSSLLQILRDAGTIPSMSYSYSAGAYYNRTNGLLILGGYDTASYIANSVPFTFASDPNNVLSVGLLSISSTTNGNTTQLSDSSVSALIDSTVSELWLPESWCDNFANTFNLTFNANNQLYTLSDEAITTNNNNNPTVTIEIANTLNENGNTVSINFPWSAFSKTYSSLSDPAYNNKSYFSLRRSTGQYTLGRAFLQEAVLTVDHERKNFSVSQVVNLGNNNNPNVVSIPPLSATTSGTGGSASSSSTLTPEASSSGGGISGGAIGGIVVAVVAIAAIIAGFFLWRRRRNQHSRYKNPEDAKADTPGPMPSTFNEKSAPAEMPTPRPGNNNDPMLDYHTQQRHNVKAVMAMSNNDTSELQGDAARAQSPLPLYRPPGNESTSMDGGAIAARTHPLHSPPAELPANRAASELHSEHASPISSPHFSPSVSELAPSPGEEGATASDMGWGTSPAEPQSPHSAESVSLSPVRAHIRDIRGNRASPNVGSSNRGSDVIPTMSATSGPLPSGLGIHDREVSESLRRQDSTRSRNSEQTLVSGLTGTNTLPTSSVSAAFHSPQNVQRKPARD